MKSSYGMIGGKTVYLDCEDKDKLKQFYRNNGFTEFGKRYLGSDEQDTLEGLYLIQMIKYLD